MNRKLLTTTLLSISLLSLNLATAGTINCTGGVCMVDLSTITPKAKKIVVKQKATSINEYETLMIDNIETIVFPHSKYVMTEDEVGEYDLNQMKILGTLTTSSLTSEGLTISDEFCEDNLTPVLVVGTENTYECVKS